MANEFLSLIVTAQCNLRCSYCYQNAKNARKAEWNVVQAAIDMAFGEGSSQINMMFWGGEPLLEFDFSASPGSLLCGSPRPTPETLPLRAQHEWYSDFRGRCRLPG